jgi:glucuronate isomerase
LYRVVFLISNKFKNYSKEKEKELYLYLNKLKKIMKAFMDDNFVLQTETAQFLFHEHAKKQAIIDYHCHLNPKEIAENRQFDNLGQIWLEGDHYKWRAMRTNGIAERFITGKDTSDWEKFEKWAETVPYTMRNPLYHWTHLELKTAFGVQELLKPETAKAIYEKCTALLRTPEFSARGLMKKYNVEVVCTTDDPIDSLEYHIALQKETFPIKVLPTWRPDKAMTVENPKDFRMYIEKLSDVSGVSIRSFADLLQALRVRHDFFASVGCTLSDHGFEKFYSDDYSESEIEKIFCKIFNGNELDLSEIEKYKSAILFEGGKMDYEKGWTQQFHYGVIRNNNTRMFQKVGADTGFDSIADPNTAKSLSKFLNKLDAEGKLAKTVLYNLNPRDNEMIATMIGNFQEGPVAGKIQFGSGWWFLDQKTGMEAQINALSALGLLSRFVGMLTDSRSFLSYPRHEYFRRILCNLIGNDVEQGLLPSSELPFLGQLVENVSYYNAKNYFGW